MLVSRCEKLVERYFKTLGAVIATKSGSTEPRLKGTEYQCSGYTLLRSLFVKMLKNYYAQLLLFS